MNSAIEILILRNRCLERKILESKRKKKKMTLYESFVDFKLSDTFIVVYDNLYNSTPSRL